MTSFKEFPQRERLTSRLGYKASYAGRRIFNWGRKKKKKGGGAQQKPERHAKAKRSKRNGSFLPPPLQPPPPPSQDNRIRVLTANFKRVNQKQFYCSSNCKSAPHPKPRAPRNTYALKTSPRSRYIQIRPIRRFFFSPKYLEDPFQYKISVLSNRASSPPSSLRHRGPYSTPYCTSRCQGQVVRKYIESIYFFYLIFKNLKI